MRKNISKHKKWQQYRLNIKNALILVLLLAAIGAGLMQIKLVQDLISYATKTEVKSIVVDAKGITRQLNRPWENLAQGGENRDFSVIPMVKELRKMSVKYIRIDHLYDFYVDVQRNEEGIYRYDFSRLDRIIEEIQSVGALPFISLSYMPLVLNSDIVGKPNDYVGYGQVIAKTIEHISGKNNLNITNVYYEVWNEPDLFGQWKTYGDKNYLNLYQAAASASKTIVNVNTFKLGGPATTKLYDNWVNSLLKLVVDNNLQFDFYSWHHYTHETEDYRQDMIRIKELLKKYPTKAMTTELIISEWGPDSENNQVYDGWGSAAHLVLGLEQMMPDISKAFVFEIQDGKSPDNKEYWGRWGIFTANEMGAKIKPRGQILTLLSELGSEQLSVAGNGSYVKAIAARKNNIVQIMIANYDEKNRHVEEFPLSVIRLDSGKYRVSKNFLGKSISHEEVMIGDGVYATLITMPSNSVCYLTINPLW